jgi:hypothetical protein
VFVLMWDRGAEADPIVWVLATDAGSDAARYQVMKENWHEVAAYADYPDEIPADLDEARTLWDDAREQNADPKIGVLTIDEVTIGA